MTSPESDREFIYVGDPMCSWCWGFAPVLERLDAHYDLPVRTVVGGLRPGEHADALDDEMREFLLHHWEQVEEKSGQPFDPSVLDRDGWVYDTEPACRAVVAMRDLAPHETLRWFARLQRAFYAEGVDITDLDTVPGLLDGFDVEPAEYADHLSDPATLERTRADFSEARSYGATGFPTLLYRDGDEGFVVTAGFLPWERLEPGLTRWLEQRHGRAPRHVAHAVDDA